MGILSDIFSPKEEVKSETLNDLKKIMKKHDISDTNIDGLSIIEQQLPNDHLERTFYVLLSDLIERDIINSNSDNINYKKLLDYYNIILALGNNTDQLQTNITIFMFVVKEYFEKGDCRFLSNIYHLYRDKQLFLEFYKTYCDFGNTGKYDYDLVDQFLKETRLIYLDELQYHTMVMDYLGQYKKYDASTYTKKYLEKVKIYNGIYDLNNQYLEETYCEVKRIEDKAEHLETIIEDKEISYKEMTNNLDKKIDETKAFKKKLFEELHEYLDEIKILMAAQIDNIVNCSNEEQEKIQQLLKSMDVNKIEKILAMAITKPTGEVKAEYEKIIIPRIYSAKQAVSGNLSSYLNPDIPLTERYKKALEKKQKSEDTFHEKFDLILKNILSNFPVLLVGDSGSGKSVSAVQLANILDIPFYNIGYITDEYKLLGYNDVNGNYVDTIFYEAYKNGGLCFFDEIDNSIASAALILNSFVNNGANDEFIFPNNERVKRHPNFRIIAAANTWGYGASKRYNVRQQLDSSTLDRFVGIEYNYSKKIEHDILNGKEDLYYFLKNVRSAINYNEISDVLTTRNMTYASEMLDSGIFSIEEILNTLLIKGKDIDTLNSILSYVESNCSYSNQYVKTFSKIIENR